ncbi:unnamed protein product, partial [Nesidiocoris tenuis]
MEPATHWWKYAIIPNTGNPVDSSIARIFRCSIGGGCLNDLGLPEESRAFMAIHSTRMFRPRHRPMSDNFEKLSDGLQLSSQDESVRTLVLNSSDASSYEVRLLRQSQSTIHKD